MQVCKLQEMGPRIHPTDGYVVVSEEVGHLGWDYTQADKHFKSMSNLNSGLLDKSGKGDKKFQFRSVNFPDTLRACLWKWPPGVPPERDCEQNSAGHFCVWVFPHSGFRTMWEKNHDMLIYKISSRNLSSSHDLLLFLSADPKERAALICQVCLNFSSYLGCKMLNVIVWKGHYHRHGHWSLQLMGPLVNNHFLPFNSESQIKLKQV